MAARLIVLSAAYAAAATEFTSDTFDAARAGKHAFVKFLAPW